MNPICQSTAYIDGTLYMCAEEVGHGGKHIDECVTSVRWDRS